MKFIKFNKFGTWKCCLSLKCWHWDQNKESKKTQSAFTEDPSLQYHCQQLIAGASKYNLCDSLSTLLVSCVMVSNVWTYHSKKYNHGLRDHNKHNSRSWRLISITQMPNTLYYSQLYSINNSINSSPISLLYQFVIIDFMSHKYDSARMNLSC